MNKKMDKENLMEIPRVLALCDLDGTLLNSEGKISQFSERIIKKFTSRGNIFCIATGRPLRGSIKFYKQLGLKNILVNYNGSFMSNPSNDSYSPLNLGFNRSILAKILANKEITGQIENILVEHSSGYALYKKPTSRKQVKALFNHFHLDDKEDFIYIKRNLSNIKGDIHSILLDLKDHARFDNVFFEVKQITSTLMVRNWSVHDLGTIIEINSIFSSKGMALKYLSAYYGIPLENCLAFGDGDNDAEMLRTAFFSYAMKNGTTTAKLSARYVTEKNNNEDGVAYELQKFFEL